MPALKGIHYAIESGRLAAEAAFAALQRGRDAVGRRGALAGYDEAMRESFIWNDLKQVRNMRQAFGRGFWLGGALAGAMTASQRQASRRGDVAHRARRRAGADPHRPREALPGAGRQADLRQALVRLPSGNKTRDDQPNHIRVETRVPREVAELWAHMCPAQVYEVGEEDARQGRGAGDAVELRPVRRDHRQGRPPDPARGRLGPGVHAHVTRH